MNFSKFKELRTDNLILRRIAEADRQFISDMFADSAIRKYYIVPKEARQDYRNLINYWFNDISNEAGCAWIIIEKGKGFFSKDKQCGFFTFEFRDSLQNARISYALRPEFRGKGIVTKTAKIVINMLKELGVVNIEADIDKDNLASEKVVVSLGFTTNKRQALVDPEMMREGEIRFRHLWTKNLSLKQKDLLEKQNSDTERLEIKTSQIQQWKGKIFKGNQFNSWIYDDTFPLDKLKEMGYPYTMACFEIAPNEVIAMGMDRDSQTPRDFISENQNNIFVLDESKQSRKIKSMFGEKIVHYAKRTN
jgi:RimJ/RimL family protein N-acetyltransferase